MARFKTVERPKETICNLITKSMQKIKNKKGRLQGRRSKGVQKGLLREVLVKGVVTNLVKVANKELRFPKEITRDKRINQAVNQSPAPRLTSPTKSPQPKRWQSPPASTKRNLLKIELQNDQGSAIQSLNTDVASTSPKKSPSASLSPRRNILNSPKSSPKTASSPSSKTVVPQSPIGNKSPNKRSSTSSPAKTCVSTFGKSLKAALGGSPHPMTSVKNSPGSKAAGTSALRRGSRIEAHRLKQIEQRRHKVLDQRRAKMLGLASAVGGHRNPRTRVVGTVKRLRRK